MRLQFCLFYDELPNRIEFQTCMKTKIYILIAVSVLLPLHFVSAAFINVELNSLSQIGEDFLFTNPTPNGGNNPATDSLTFSVSGLTVDTEVFTFDFIISGLDASGNSLDLTSATNFAGNAGNSGSSNRFSNGDVVTLTVANISNPNVVFDGIAGVGLNFAGAPIGIGFTADIGDGQQTAFVSDAGGTNTANDARQGQTPGNIIFNGQPVIFQNGIELTQTNPNGGLAGTIRGVNLQFSTVPEPVSFSLILALIALPFLSRHRRLMG